jgi:CubicO group peptidase (beta-lactamase class C family)
MAGFPPAQDKIVRYADASFYRWPQLRWSFNHIEQLVPTKSVWRGPGAARQFDYCPVEFDSESVTTLDGERLTWAAANNNHQTDGLAILHKGRLVYERYFGACGPQIRHITQSSNKSVVGTLALCLIHEGRLDPDALVPTIIPELQDSAWRDATVRQVLDMQVSMKFHEDYTDPTSDVWRFHIASGMAPPKLGELPNALADVLPEIQKDSAHGVAFEYREPNVFVLGWLIRRAGGQDIATQVSERIWQQIGAEQDSYYMIDVSGAETTSAMTLRDFIRFGQLICNGGRVGDKQVIPAEVIDEITPTNNTKPFPETNSANPSGWSYRSHWWYRELSGRVCPAARGAHGQLLYIDPHHELVIARFGSAPQAPSAGLDNVLLPMIDLITDKLSDRSVAAR